MKGIVESWAVAVAMMAACMCALLVACSDSHGPKAGTSGSNWLKCTQLADCKTALAVNAVACSAEGLCVDAEGEPIAARPGQGGASGAGSGSVSGAGGAMAAGSSEPMSTAGRGWREPCPWTIDELLMTLGVTADDRISCGRYGYWDVTSIAGAMYCFERAEASGASVELTINNCIDCSKPTTYVTTNSGELHFAITREDDMFAADRLRKATILSCTSLDFDTTSGMASCIDPVNVYDCSEPQNPNLPSETPLPVTPLKLADVPLAENAPRVTLHLYVSNQSFDAPLVNIEVSIDETRVVTGDYAVEDQHSWHEFEIIVPTGSHTLHVWSSSHEADLDQLIDLPGERWAVINYWNEGTPDSETFSLALHDEPVTFE
jgi:hypothetical protein